LKIVLKAGSLLLAAPPRACVLIAGRPCRFTFERESKMAQGASSKPVTKIRIQVPKGTKVEDVLKGLELTFEPAEDSAAQFNTTNFCCVDVAVVGPFATIASNGGGGDGGETA
jgi:hypothetical protein